MKVYRVVWEDHMTSGGGWENKEDLSSLPEDVVISVGLVAEETPKAITLLQNDSSTQILNRTKILRGAITSIEEATGWRKICPKNLKRSSKEKPKRKVSKASVPISTSTEL